MIMKKQKGNLKIDSNTVVHCPTEELAREVLKVAHELGWCDTEEYLLSVWRDVHKEETVYNFLGGSYSNVTFFTEIEPKTIISAQNFLALHNAGYCIDGLNMVMGHKATEWKMSDSDQEKLAIEELRREYNGNRGIDKPIEMASPEITKKIIEQTTDIQKYGFELIENKPIKNDRIDNKVRMELLPFAELEEIAKVYTFGAEKYYPNSWQKIENGYERYKGALLRHLTAIEKGETHDPESGLLHASHLAWNAIAMLHFKMKEDE